jgi:hypothetical protein
MYFPPKPPEASASIAAQPSGGVQADALPLLIGPRRFNFALHFNDPVHRARENLNTGRSDAQVKSHRKTRPRHPVAFQLNDPLQPRARV